MAERDQFELPCTVMRPLITPVSVTYQHSILGDRVSGLSGTLGERPLTKKLLLNHISRACPSSFAPTRSSSITTHLLALSVSGLSAEDWPRRPELLLAIPRNRCGCRFHPLHWIDHLSSMA